MCLCETFKILVNPVCVITVDIISTGCLISCGLYQEKVQLGRICCRPIQYSGSGFDFQAGPTQYDSQAAFDIPAGIKFPF
jgi:hypothetical protein